jgi:hypothetical protein
MKYKTAELTGALLDAAVAKAEKNLHFRLCNNQYEMAAGTAVCMAKKKRDKSALWHRFAPSADWYDGGPLIERLGVCMTRVPANGRREKAFWAADIMDEAKRVSDHEGGTMPTYYHGHGSTALEAAMRCYVMSRLGEEIEL